MKKIFTAVAIMLFLCASHMNAYAAFRCPNENLVDVGDSIAVVSVKCDPPATVTKTTVPVETSKGKIRYDDVQEWVYTAGSNLIHILKFRNGILVSIDTGGFVP